MKKLNSLQPNSDIRYRRMVGFCLFDGGTMPGLDKPGYAWRITDAPDPGFDRATMAKPKSWTKIWIEFCEADISLHAKLDARENHDGVFDLFEGRRQR